MRFVVFHFYLHLQRRFARQLPPDRSFVSRLLAEFSVVLRFLFVRWTCVGSVWISWNINLRALKWLDSEEQAMQFVTRLVWSSAVDLMKWFLDLAMLKGKKFGQHSTLNAQHFQCCWSLSSSVAAATTTVSSVKRRHAGWSASHRGGGSWDGSGGLGSYFPSLNKPTPKICG